MAGAAGLVATLTASAPTSRTGGCQESEPYECTDGQASGFRTELPLR